MKHLAISIIITTAFPLAIAWAGNDPGASVQLIFDEAYKAPHELPLKIAKEVQSELTRRGSKRLIEIAMPGASFVADSGSITVEIVQSDWTVKKALSIPYILNRYKIVYKLGLTITAVRPDGTPFFKRIEVEKGTGVEAQILTNDRHDPDLQIEHSKRLELESAAAEEVSRNLAKKILALIR